LHFKKENKIIDNNVKNKTTEDVLPSKHPQTGGELSVSEMPHLYKDFFNVPWGHHKLVMDKVKGDVRHQKSITTNKILSYTRPTTRL